MVFVRPRVPRTRAESGQGPDSCNLAACHSCALLPETSCEEFNRFLVSITGSLTAPKARVEAFFDLDRGPTDPGRGMRQTIIEAHIQEERLEDDDGGGDMVCCHNIETKSGDVLQFQVTDNGYELYIVATPYDVRYETTRLDDSITRQV